MEAKTQTSMPSYTLLNDVTQVNGGRLRLFREEPGESDNPIPSNYWLQRVPPCDNSPWGHNEQDRLHYQNGPVKERGVNGWQHREVILTILDRLNAAQEGPFACEENARQIEHLIEFVKLDDLRTARRMAAGTEGTNEGK